MEKENSIRTNGVYNHPMPQTLTFWTNLFKKQIKKIQTLLKFPR